MNASLMNSVLMQPEIHLKALDNHKINLYIRQTFAFCYLD